MNAFDNFLGKARDVADAATKATGEVIEVSKLKLQVSKLYSDIKRTYERLGQITYDGKKQGVDNSALIDEMVRDIDSMTAQIEILNKKMGVDRNSVTCGGCGNANPEGSFYCSRCGASIGSEEK